MKITIITVTFNSGLTIRDTIQSILNQKYEDIEYIVVDGCSKDNTVKIIKEYEPLFKGRMRWISEPDKGIYDAMNKGLKMTTGDVVGFLNSDDFYTSSNVLDQVALNITKGNYDAVYGDVHYVDGDNLYKCVRYYSSKSFKPKFMKYGFMPAHPSFYAKKRVYDEYGCFSLDYKIAADFDILLRLIYVNKIKTKYISLDFVTMRTRGLSTSGVNSHLAIIKDHLKALKKNNINSNILFLFYRYIYKIIELNSFRILKRNKC
jgi:glycosyltransferase involved in cell wall biosynthesis